MSLTLNVIVFFFYPFKFYSLYIALKDAKKNNTAKPNIQVQVCGNAGVA